MEQETKNAIALMRYSVIAPLITGLSDNYDSLTAFFLDASVKGVLHALHALPIHRRLIHVDYF